MESLKAGTQHPFAAVTGDIDYFRLAKVEIWGAFEHALHIVGVGSAIHLGAGAVDGGTFAEIEHTALQGVFIRSDAHFAAESVYLAHEVTL